MSEPKEPPKGFMMQQPLVTVAKEPSLGEMLDAIERGLRMPIYASDGNRALARLRSTLAARVEEIAEDYMNHDSPHRDLVRLAAEIRGKK